METWSAALWNFLRIGTLNRVKGTLKEFMNSVKRLRRTDFQFRFAGIQMSKMKVDEIDFEVQVTDKYGRLGEGVFNEYAKNYQLIDPDATFDFIYHLDHTLRVNNSPEVITSRIFQKFPKFTKFMQQVCFKTKSTF